MAYINNMSKLIEKIERRLGTRGLNLPDHLKKETWADIIKDETLLTFSRYFPHKIRITLSKDLCYYKDGYYIIDEDKFPGIEILGVRDISWENFENNTLGMVGNYDIYDTFSYYNNIEDIAIVQTAVDRASLYNNEMYVEFEYPNKIAIKNAMNINITQAIREFPVDLFIKHSDNLNTISPTIMEIFENLAKADIADYLYNELKYYDGLDTSYGNIDLRLSDLENHASKRDDIIEHLKDSYVSASNTNQPLMFTV